jgi:hypothetical protein
MATLLRHATNSPRNTALVAASSAIWAAESGEMCGRASQPLAVIIQRPAYGLRASRAADPAA